MKSLQERMDGMKPYFRAIEVYNDALMVRVVLPSSWKIYPSADGNEATYEDIFDLVEETIKANQDIVLKLKLLREKVEELKELFSTHSFDELQTLRFEFSEAEKPKPKRKYTKKKKEAEKAAEEPLIEENNVIEETVEE